MDDKDPMSALWLKNTRESDPHGYEVTLAVTNKAKSFVLLYIPACLIFLTVCVSLSVCFLCGQ